MLAGFAALVLVLALGGPSAYAPTPSPLEEQSLRVAWSPHAFLNVPRNEVEAAFRALAETVGRQRGYLVRTTNTIHESSAAIDEAAGREAFDLLLVDANTYLRMRATNHVAPRFVSTDRGQFGKRYLLLTHATRGPAALAGLRGTDIGVFEQADTSLGRFWLDILLHELGVEERTGFFHAVISCGKPSTAVLPVFFGKAAACVVDHESFGVLTELNPQVGKSLRVIAESERLIDGFVCVRTTAWSSEKFRRDLEATLLELHLQPAGEQLLSLIKARRLVPFEASHLEAVRRLHARHAAYEGSRP